MKKRITVEVKTHEQATAIRRALEDPASKALMITVGLLLPLSVRAQARTLQFVADHFDEVDNG